MGKEQEVSWHDWGWWLMWHGDGQPERHLTFSLVLYNKLFWRQLHQQIQVAVNISLFCPCQSIGGILCNALSTGHNFINADKEANSV